LVFKATRKNELRVTHLHEIIDYWELFLK